MEPSSLYPVALNLHGKTCIVVGGGSVGRRKADALREAGAEVTVLSLETTGPFEETQLEGAFLVVAATDDPAVNDAVAQAAHQRGVLLNLAAPGEETDEGDFATMASVRRGSLLLAVTTGGAGPALSARLKRELHTQFGPEWALLTALLAEARAEAKKRIADPAERTERLRALANSETLLEKLRTGDFEGAMQETGEHLSITP
ncbi:MAG: bifunctional precorrin-2 dehydrogenase/sirohydrochlorin ferrochelatase [Armatimonas sp.]